MPFPASHMYFRMNSLMDMKLAAQRDGGAGLGDKAEIALSKRERELEHKLIAVEKTLKDALSARDATQRVLRLHMGLISRLQRGAMLQQRGAQPRESNKLREKLANAKSKYEKRSNENAKLREELKQLSSANSKYERLSKENAKLRAELKSLRLSTSWRITGPLRSIAALVSSIRRRVISDRGSLF